MVGRENIASFGFTTIDAIQKIGKSTISVYNETAPVQIRAFRSTPCSDDSLMVTSEGIQLLLGELVEQVAKDKKCDPNDDRQCRCLADIPELERHLVGENARRFRRDAGTAPGQDVYRVENLEG